jgi:hypothetical protein
MTAPVIHFWLAGWGPTPPVHRSFTNSGFSGSLTQVSVSAPSGLATDDLVVVQLSKENNAAVNRPTGFSEKAQDFQNNIQQTIFYGRRGGASDIGAGPWVFSWTGSTFAGTDAHRISNAITTGDPFEDSEQLKVSGNANFPTTQVDTLDDARLLTWFGVCNNSDVYTPPSGFTEIFEEVNHTAAWKTQAAAGSSGSLGGSSGDVDNKVVFLGAIKPAGAAEQYDETGRTVSITASVTAVDTQDHIETTRAVTTAATVAAVDTQDHIELAKLVSAAATVAAATDAQKHVETGHLVSTAVTVTATDRYVFLETDRLVAVAVTVTAVDVQDMSETGRLVAVAVTVAAVDVQHAIEVTSVTTTVVITAASSHHANELTRSVSLAATVTVADTQVMKELARLIAIAVTVTAEDSQTGAPVNYNETGRLVALTVTVAAMDTLRLVEITRLVSVSVAVTVTAQLRLLELPVAIASLTVTSAGQQQLAEAALLVILLTVSAVEIFTPAVPPEPWVQPIGGIAAEEAGAEVEHVVVGSIEDSNPQGGNIFRR